MSDFDIFHADRHTNNNKTNTKSFHAKYNNSQDMQNMTKARNDKNQIFKSFINGLW